MDLTKIINQFLGSGSNTPSSDSSNIGGLASGALAGGAMALLLGNKSARKLAGKAATVGGMALLGGVAYQAFKNWQGSRGTNAAQSVDINVPEALPPAFLPSTNQVNGSSFEMSIIKAMIAAARADGQIDLEEQEQVFKNISTKNLTNDEKSLVFELMHKPISIKDITSNLQSLEHKSEAYIAAYLVCKGDSPKEQAFLASLAESLNLPQDLVAHLEIQSRAVVADG